MAGENISANMNMPVPAPGVTAGPQWATDIVACLAIVDGHNHTAGNGVQITPSGLNINANLPMSNNALTAVGSVQFTPGSAPSAVDALYVNGVDLYYKDGNSNLIPITASGAVAGTPGSIASLTSPASATYVAGSQTFVWQSAASTPANLDGASLLLRNLSASSKALTLNPPTAMSANYSITLPSLPGGLSLVALDASGNMSAPYSISGGLNASVLTAASITATQIANATITATQIASATITQALMAANSIGTSQLIAASVTKDKLSAVNFAVSGTISFNVLSATLAVVTGLTVAVTGSGSRPIRVELQAPSTTAGSNITMNSVTFELGCQNSATSASVVHLWAGASNAVQNEPPNIYSFVDTTPAVGTNTYQIYARIISGSLFQFNNVQLVAYEL